MRVDSGVTTGGEISPSYDPMIAKLIVWDADREQATARMLRALGEYEIEGLTTLIPFHRALMATEQWADAQTCRDLLEDPDWLASTAGEPTAGGVPTSPAETLEQDYTVEVSGRRFDVKVIGPPPAAGAVNGTAARKPPRRQSGGGGSGGAGGDALVSPMQGTVLRVAVEQGATVEEGSLIAVVEAMKMENEITAHKPGTISELPIEAGGAVASGDTARRHHRPGMSAAWVAGPDEARAVAALMAQFRDHLGSRGALRRVRAPLGRADHGRARQRVPARGRRAVRGPAAALPLERVEGRRPTRGSRTSSSAPTPAAPGWATRSCASPSSAPATGARAASSWTASRTTPPRSRSTSATGSTPTARAPRAPCC